MSLSGRLRVDVKPLLLIPLGFGVHVALPWAISFLTPRFGWNGGGPNSANLIGLIPAAAGLAMIAWALSLHFVSDTGVVRWEAVPRHLLLRGPYRFSRNPMYVLELVMWLGWTLFYGSVAVFVGLVLWWMFFAFYQVPTEERQLEARFGESYRRYRDAVPRWLGFRERG
jgi:protein-S-isoprenylcysteine O-methyltransferase Ste14